MAVAKRIQLFYDVISPYSWIGFETLCRYRSRWNMELEFCPFFLGGVMNASNNRPPGMVPAKAIYMGSDVSRLAKYYQIPMKPPANPAEVMFSKGSLRAQRFLVATQSVTPDKVEHVSRQLWMRVWSRDEDITENASLREAGQKAGVSEADLDKMLAMAETPEVKERLKQRTQEAVDLGCFGSPFIVVHMGGSKETFFGSDRFELMASVIGEKWEGPLTDVQAQL